MNKKTKIIVRLISLSFALVFIICNVGLENVSAFWNKDEDNDNRRNAMVTMELMHCYHKDTHYDNNGRHIYTK